ncbi:MAG: CopG family transcriptional regulator [Sphingomonas sp. 28-62-20]|uniref:CopG family ribbon-helix-helix protein n=1 Tax=Sphingomonas sp. 28-62-20 TaxID=1970433 RepID=UPI000BCFAD4E|nr:MAG: CopG family transcriptional regulator [Sphingomonas sp. 28-62-20]
MSSMTMTIRVPTDVSDKLARLAKGTRRSRSFLAAEAVAAYVDRELSIIDGIEQGMADVAAGRVVPHDIAMDRVDTVIAKARADRA